MIYLYTDGSVARPTEGKSPGGWAYTFRYDGKVYQESGCCNLVTSNQMEMMAAIKVMQRLLNMGLEGERICIVSDSQYLINGASQWLLDWKRKGWLNGKGRKLKNREFWKQIDYLSAHFKIRFKWIRGHNGHPDNEAVDKLARAAAFRAAGLEQARYMA